MGKPKTRAMAKAEAEDEDEGHEIIMPDGEYDNLWNKVMSMPEKKRKNWKGQTEDNLGMLTRVRYDPKEGRMFGFLYKYRKWYLVVKRSEVRHKVLHETKTREEVREELGKFGRNTAMAEAVLWGDDDDFNAVVDAEQKANHTGNHYRTHKISVPSGSDGRVRG